MWIKAADLKVGMRTGGGLVVSVISTSGPMFNVTWSRDGKKRPPIGYHPSQAFDIQEESTVAQKVTIETTSDLSGDADASTVAFGIDGRQYEIDLTEKEAGQLRKALTKYVDAARSLGRAPRNGRSKAVQSGPSAAEIRAWAVSNGHEVPARGRIPEAVRQAFDAAH